MNSYPVHVNAHRDDHLSRWLWLVKWVLLIPHYLVLVVLWIAFVVTTLVAYVAVLFTGRYPRGLYDLLLGIARWSLRVIAYVALLTDQYPPFRLDQGDDEPGSDPVGPASPTTARPAEPGGVVPATDTGPQGSAAAPVTALVAGVMLLLLAAGVGLGAATLIGLNSDRDANGYPTSPTLQVNSSTSAVTVEGINLHAGELWTRHLSSIGGVRIGATNATGTPLFVGIAPQAAVNGWLAGTAHDRLVTLTTDPSSRYERSNGDFAVVLANSDGTPAVSAAG